MKELLLKIASDYPDGFTVRLEDLKHVTKGVAVAYKETQNCFDSEGLNKVINHAKDHGQTVGGWKDGKRYYFDSVRIFPNEQLNEAIEFGRQNGQIAIFDITNLKEIRL